MIADCKAGIIDLIITKSVSRFARNVMITIGMARDLSHLKPPVGIFFESECIFSLNDDSQMALTFQATMAEEESHTRSRSMETSLRMRLDNGIPLTPKILGYSHDADGHLIVNPEEAPTVKLAFYMYLYGYTTQQIADAFNALGRKSYLGNINWTPAGIVHILRNERHCGDVLTRKTFTEDYRTHRTLKNKGDRPQSRYLNHHEAIISRDDFIAVQRMLDNSRYGNRSILPKLRVIDSGILKKGRFLPWIRISSVLMPFATVFFFSMPFSVGNTAKCAWVIIGYVLWDICYTMCDAPIYALCTSMTNNMDERNSLLSYTRISGGIGAMLAAILIPAMYGSNGMDLGWSKTALIISAFGAVLMLPAGFLIRERFHGEKEPEIGFKELSSAMTKNRNLVVIILVRFLFTLTMMSQILSSVFAQYVLGNETMDSLLTLMTLVPVLVLSVFFPLSCGNLIKCISTRFPWRCMSPALCSCISQGTGISVFPSSCPRCAASDAAALLPCLSCSFRTVSSTASSATDAETRVSLSPFKLSSTSSIPRSFPLSAPSSWQCWVSAQRTSHRRGNKVSGSPIPFSPQLAASPLSRCSKVTV